MFTQLSKMSHMQSSFAYIGSFKNKLIPKLSIQLRLVWSKLWTYIPLPPVDESGRCACAEGVNAAVSVGPEVKIVGQNWLQHDEAYWQCIPLLPVDEAGRYACGEGGWCRSVICKSSCPMTRFRSTCVIESEWLGTLNKWSNYLYKLVKQYHQISP